MPKVNVKEQRRKQLIDAAISAIAKRGVIDVTITDVAEIAGLSRGIINFYFVSKDALIEQSFKHLLNLFETSWRREMEKSKSADLETFVRAQFGSDICNQKRLHVWLACFGLSVGNKTYGTLARNYSKKFEEMAEPLLQQAGSPLNGQGLLSLIYGAWQYLAVDWSASAREDIAAHYVELIMSPMPLNPPKAQKPAVSAEKPAKKAPRPAPISQLDFGDLFALES